MRTKLDENLDARLANILKEDGHDVSTVREQGATGISDEELYNHCISEGLVLVTMDKDFSNVIHYPPQNTSGIIVLRGPQ